MMLSLFDHTIRFYCIEMDNGDSFDWGICLRINLGLVEFVYTGKACNIKCYKFCFSKIVKMYDTLIHICHYFDMF